LTINRALTLCTWYRNRVLADNRFAMEILWTDEATFTRNGINNLYTEHIWAHVNSHASTVSRFQYQWRINVWAGIIGNRIIGPTILPATLNAANYMELLRNYVETELEELPVRDYFNVIYLHDGAPAHYARDVQDYLETRFTEWIGRSGRVPWPPRPPDLTPLDFFLWSY
jgi:hypothetical protein